MPVAALSQTLRDEGAVSVVVPVRDEVESLELLHREVVSSLEGCVPDFELIFVDDGSRDGSLARLRSIERRDHRVRVLTLGRHRGQSTALQAGFRAARFEVVATLDADLQNDPRDLPRLLAHLDRADVVNGVREQRRDSLSRILASRFANAVRNRLTSESVSDVGCSIRVMRRHFLQQIELESGLHRFLPTLLRLRGARVVELPVSHRPRRFGRSKYGMLDRLWSGGVDLWTVRSMQGRARRRELRRVDEEDEEVSRRSA